MMEPRLRPRSKTAGAVRGQIRRFPIPLPFKTKRCNGELSSKLFTGTYVEVSGIENALFYRASRTLLECCGLEGKRKEHAMHIFSRVVLCIASDCKRIC
jgi:hypothetical protein